MPLTTYVSPRDSREIVNKLVSFLESNLTDPYEQVSGKSRTNFVYGDDFKLVPLPPKIHISQASFNPTKISQSKSNYLEEEEHTFLIYYYNQRGHKFTFSDNSLTLIDESQCMKYLQYIRDTIKSNISQFDNFFHQHRFGEIPKPKFNPNGSLFFSFLPLVVKTYRR